MKYVLKLENENGKQIVPDITWKKFRDYSEIYSAEQAFKKMKRQFELHLEGVKFFTDEV